MALDSSLAPKLVDPFDPLPVCSPGMLVGPDGLPARSGYIASEPWLRARPNAITLPPYGDVSQPSIPDSTYPLRVAWDGILVDDPDHPDDVGRRVREVLELLWGNNAPAIEQEACQILGIADLRDWFRRPVNFFDNHLKRYSKSRRKAPIYWPLSTPSGSYTLWVYYPRLSSDTLFTAVNRYIEPKIATAERQFQEARTEADRRTGREATWFRTQAEDAQRLLRELQDLRQELMRVAALPYQPDLNDGVIINAAPLHRLFRMPRWARDTMEVWKKLERGDYDWAHLALTIWPERVREKCRTDRSLAIAHNLEELYVGTHDASGSRKRRRKGSPATDAGEVRP
jgi:hypothetical protein